MPLAKGVARESVSATVAVSSTATVPNKAKYIALDEPAPDIFATPE